MKLNRRKTSKSFPPILFTTHPHYRWRTSSAIHQNKTALSTFIKRLRQIHSPDLIGPIAL